MVLPARSLTSTHESCSKIMRTVTRPADSAATTAPDSFGKRRSTLAVLASAFASGFTSGLASGFASGFGAGLAAESAAAFDSALAFASAAVLAAFDDGPVLSRAATFDLLRPAACALRLPKYTDTAIPVRSKTIAAGHSRYLRASVPVGCVRS